MLYRDLAPELAAVYAGLSVVRAMVMRRRRVPHVHLRRARQAGEKCPIGCGSIEPMSKQRHTAATIVARQAYAGVAPARRATVRHGIVIAGACVAFGAVLALEGLVSSALEVKIECSSKGMDFASWMSKSKVGTE